MIELVINAPHLQTWPQRLAAFAINLIGWLLWCYFFFPLVSLACWFLDYAECSQWVNLAGGYLSLRDILILYGYTLAAMLLAWLAWAAYNLRKRRGREPAIPVKPVGCEELCEAFQVSQAELEQCRESRFAIVHFDPGGHIIGLEKG